MASDLVSVTIGNIDISSRLQKLVIRRKATEGIGSFELTLRNQDQGLGVGDLPADSLLTVNLAQNFGGTKYGFFKGYLDVPAFISTQENKSKITSTVQLTGRDLGQDLQNKTVWGSDEAPIKTLIYRLLTYGASPVPNGTPTGYTEIACDFPGFSDGVTSPQDTSTKVLFNSDGRSFISDVIKRMLSDANYDGYVDINKKWQSFPVGTVSSGINLYCLPDDSRNNIIGSLTVKPVDACELRNVIVGFGNQDINDAWTDYGMAQFWTPEVYPASGGNAATSCTIIDYTQASDIYKLPQAGASVLKITNTTSGYSLHSFLWGLNFPGLFHYWLPFNQISLATIKWCAYAANANGTPEGRIDDATKDEWQEPSISLTDTIGNVITFIFGGIYQFNKWLTFEVNVGYNISTEAQIYSQDVGHGTALLPLEGIYDKWYYTAWSTASGNTGFNWKIKNITFQSGAPMDANNVRVSKDIRDISYVLFDNLVIPQVQVCATADHSGYTDKDRYGVGLGVCPICFRHFDPSPYKERQLPVTRTNIYYQRDLENYVETVANQRMTPLSTVNLQCDGRAGLVNGAWQWLPGKNISLNGSEYYRMVEIIHTIERDVNGSGFSHVVELSLVPKTLQLNMEQWTYSRYGDVGVARQLHDRVQALENTYQLFNPTS